MPIIKPASKEATMRVDEPMPAFGVGRVVLVTGSGILTALDF